MGAAAITAAFLAMLSWGIGDFLIQRATRKVGDVEALAWIGIVGSVGLLPFVADDLALLFEARNLGVLLFLGVLTFVVAIIAFEALKRGKISVVDVIWEVELPITILLGMIFFGESLTPLQWGLIAAIFAGILLIALDPKDFKGRFAVEAGAFLALVAAFGMGGINFLTAVGAKAISPLLAVWFPWVVFTLICFGVVLAKGEWRNFGNHAKRFPTLLLWMGAMDTLAWLFFAIALERADLSITTAITESYPVIALMLGVIINREKVGAHQYAGAALTIAAAVTMAVIS